MIQIKRSNTPVYFQVIAKPTGAVCNLDCKYCYFLSKEILYPESTFRMSEETLNEYIKQLFELQQGARISINWQGGEPTLMGLDFFNHAIELVDSYKHPDIQITHTIQTNGTLIDAEWCKFFHRNGFLVGLSLDGPAEVHNAYRLDKAGKPTYEKVMRAARLLKQYNVDFNILCTVHAANARHPLEVYRFFRDKVKADFIQFIPIVERVTPEIQEIANKGWGETTYDRPLYKQQGNLVTERSITAEQWGQFLIAIFDEWIRYDVGKMFVQLFESALASWMDQPASLCVFGETCGTGLVLEHNGDLYSCDHFVEPDFFLGNIMEKHIREVAAFEKHCKFGNDKFDMLPRYCLECPVLFACYGECPRNRFIQTPDGEPGLNYLCTGYKSFFEHIDMPMKIMADLLQQGQHPALVMKILAEKDRH